MEVPPETTLMTVWTSGVPRISEKVRLVALPGAAAEEQLYEKSAISLPEPMGISSSGAEVLRIQP